MASASHCEDCPKPIDWNSKNSKFENILKTVKSEKSSGKPKKLAN
jgi:hypothetical protein